MDEITRWPIFGAAGAAPAKEPPRLTLDTLRRMADGVTTWYATSEDVPREVAYQTAPYTLSPGFHMPAVLILHPDTLERLRAEAGGSLPAWRHIRERP